jgi:regulator of RNase E activity RraA
VCDRDGVTVVPASALEEIIKRGRARADKERDMFSKLSSGSTTVELLGLDVSTVRKPR